MIRSRLLAASILVVLPQSAFAVEVGSYRDAYTAECRTTNDAVFCSCKLASTAVEALRVKSETLPTVELDAIEALMLDTDREIYSRIRNRAPFSPTMGHDVMAYMLGKHAIAADVDTMVRVTEDASVRSTLTCGK